MEEEKENIPPGLPTKKFKESTSPERTPGSQPTVKKNASYEVPISRPLVRPQFPMDQPSYMVEFKECSSNYELPLKEESDEISSDGEFNDAKNMDIYYEDDNEVLKIE